MGISEAMDRCDYGEKALPVILVVETLGLTALILPVSFYNSMLLGWLEQ